MPQRVLLPHNQQRHIFYRRRRHVRRRPQNPLAKSSAPDQNNRIPLALRCLLVRTDQRLILVDTGIGDWHHDKFKQIYQPQTSDHLAQTLKQQNLTHNDITDIILTHLHFDHAGGLIKKTPTGLSPAYPNARLWIQQKQWDWARNPSPKDRASFLAEYLDIIDQAYRYELVEGNATITTGLEVIAYQGHTPAMQCVLLKHPDRTLFFAADLLPLSSHVRLPWLMAYDLHPLQTLKEKQQLLENASRHNWLIVFQHDPTVSAASVRKKAGKYELQPEQLNQ